MNTSLLPTGSRSDDQEPAKARETTTRRTRSTRRLLGLAVAGIVLALVRRRRRRASPGDRHEPAQTRGTSPSTGDRRGGRSLGRRVAVIAASAAAAAAVKRLLGQRSRRQR